MYLCTVNGNSRLLICILSSVQLAACFKAFSPATFLIDLKRLRKMCLSINTIIMIIIIINKKKKKKKKKKKLKLHYYYYYYYYSTTTITTTTTSTTTATINVSISIVSRGSLARIPPLAPSILHVMSCVNEASAVRKGRESMIRQDLSSVVHLLKYIWLIMCQQSKSFPTPFFVYLIFVRTKCPMWYLGF